METNIDTLIDDALKQAELYIQELGEFHPFGCTIDKSGYLRPIGVYLDEQSFSTQKIIAMLEQHIRKGIDTGNIYFGAIVLNVNIRQSKELVNGIEIKIFQSGINEIKNMYYKYTVKRNLVQFTEIKV